MKRLICIIIVLVMAMSALASCGDTQTSSTPAPSSPSGPSDNKDPNVEKPEEETINIDLDKIDYGGKEVFVYHWQPVRTDISGAEFGMNAEDINNDAINDAVYRRNLYTETELGIKINWHEQNGTPFYKPYVLIDNLEMRLSDPTTPVDIIAACVRQMPFLLVEGHLTELSMYSDSLDISKAWWPKNIMDTLDIKGNLYFVSGDIAASVLQNMNVLFTNKVRLEAIGQSYDELIAKIKAYQWTVDDLIALTNGEYQDLDNEIGPSFGDRFGLVTVYYLSDAIYTGMGYKYMIKSTKDNEVIRLSTQMAGETAMQYVTKMKDWHATNDFYMNFLEPNEDRYPEPFVNNRALFCMNTAKFGFDLQETEIKYACLPAPALDLNQGRYYTNLQYAFSAYGICKDSEDYDIAAQTIQTLGYHAYSTTTPAIFETSFQGKFAKDDYNIEMFNIIRESIVFDTGKVYDVYVATQEDGFDWIFLEYIISSVVSYGIKGNEYGQDTNYNFSSTADPVRIKLQRCINAANQKILDYLDSQK